MYRERDCCTIHIAKATDVFSSHDCIFHVEQVPTDQQFLFSACGINMLPPWPWPLRHSHPCLYTRSVFERKKMNCDTVMCVCVCVCVCVHITTQSGPVILVILCHSHWSSRGGINDTYVCVCVFSSHSFWTSSSLDVPAEVTQEEGHTGFVIHLLSAVRALTFIARRVQPFLSLVDGEVEFCVLTI